MARFTARHRKVGGRQKGVPNRRSAQGREFAEKLCGDPEYLAGVETRAKAGKLHPGFEGLLWAYAYGRPRQSLELSGSIGSGRDVSQMSTAELLTELEQHHRHTAEFLTQHHSQQPPQGD